MVNLRALRRVVLTANQLTSTIPPLNQHNLIFYADNNNLTGGTLDLPRPSEAANPLIQSNRGGIHGAFLTFLCRDSSVAL